MHQQGLNIIESASLYISLILFLSIDSFFVLYLDCPRGEDHILAYFCTESSLHAIAR